MALGRSAFISAITRVALKPALFAAAFALAGGCG
jgi:hypothetical protein